MFTKLKNLISGNSDDTPANAADVKSHDADEKHLAAAVLLVEAATQDDDFADNERHAIRQILQTSFKLDEAQADELLELATKKQDHSVEIHSFTRAVKDLFPADERVEMIEMLWEVAYADGVLHDYETSLVRKVAGLIYVSDRDRGDARKRVAAKLGIDA
jgi:uncharacterized tellurite resistance protein B-like protein